MAVSNKRAESWRPLFGVMRQTDGGRGKLLDGLLEVESAVGAGRCGSERQLVQLSGRSEI